MRFAAVLLFACGCGAARKLKQRGGGFCDISGEVQSKARCDVEMHVGELPGEVKAPRRAVCAAGGAAALVAKAAKLMRGLVYVYSTPRLDAALAAVMENATLAVNDENLCEVLLHRLLLTSPFRTLNGAEAKLFFFPYYGKVAHKTAINVRLEMESAAQAALVAQPFFEEKQGVDHIIVGTSGNGLRYFSDALQPLKHAAVAFAAENAKLAHRRNVAIPYPVQVYPNASQRWHPPRLGGNGPQDRPVSVWFQGSRGRTWNHVRNEWIGSVFGPCQNSHVQYRDKLQDFVDVMTSSYETQAKAQFCLAPRGLTPSSRRPFESLIHGCVPVILSDNFGMPYSRWLQYEHFALRLPEKCLNATPATARNSLRLKSRHLPDMWAALNEVRPLFVYEHAEGSALEAIFTSLLVEVHESPDQWNLTGLPELDAAKECRR
mmetsp:Transcript_8745/g.28762  ORF Transcript_8745/g.28762 Transcript_8745/m.28762 type:complete len:433 (+) Transcript_8745:97-1395(+)